MAFAGENSYRDLARIYQAQILLNAKISVLGVCPTLHF